MLSTRWHDPRSGGQRDEGFCSCLPACQKRARIPHASAGLSLRTIVSTSSPLLTSPSIPEEEEPGSSVLPPPPRLALEETEAQGDPGWPCCGRAVMTAEWPLACWAPLAGIWVTPRPPMAGRRAAPQTEASCLAHLLAPPRS